MLHIHAYNHCENVGSDQESVRLIQVAFNY